jgi:hypothetical protein
VGAAWRLALHDLSDPPRGYPELAQIEFLPTQLRFYPRTQSVELESADFVNAISLHPVTAFDHRLSWRVRAGAHRLRDGGCDGCLVGSLEVGSGFTATSFSERLTFFALGDVAVEVARGLRGLRAAPALRAGIGPWGGARIRLAETFVWVAAASWRWLPFTVSATTWQVESSLRWSPRPGVSIGLEGRKFVASGEAAAQLYFYF